MFCKYCGNELTENAVVCTKCGCLVGDIRSAETLKTPEIVPAPEFDFPAPTVAEDPPKPSRKYYRLTKIFSIVGLATSGIALLCALWFFGLFLLGFTVGEDGGILLVLYSVFGLLGMIGVSPFALTAGILAFVFKTKSPEHKGGLPITALVLGIVTFALGWGFYLVLIFQ